jgi:RNA polymerase sigma factor (sigma-70 family)
MKSKNDIESEAIAGQNERINATIQKERGRLLNFIRRYLPDENDAEDLLQDVFFQFTEAYRLMKPIERVSSWLFTVARNKITDRFRKKKAVPFSQLEKNGNKDTEALTILDLIPDPAAGPEAEFAANWIMEELEAALDELPEAQREAFVLHELEGYSFEEIAQMTGEKVNTLISRKRYAVLYLRACLQEFYHEYINQK